MRSAVMDRLFTDLESAIKRTTEIQDAHKDALFADWPGEQKVAWAAARESAVSLQAKVAEQEDFDKKQAEVKAASDFMNMPQYRLPRGVGNGPDDSKKAFAAAGWECKTVGAEMVWHAPTSKGLYPMFPADMFTLDRKTMDPDTAAYVRSVEAILQPGYADTWVKHLRMSTKQRSDGIALAMMSPEEQKALSEGSDGAGGNLVPAEAMAEMLVRIAQTAVIRKYARVQPTSRDLLKWPRVLPNSSSGSIYSSGFVGGVAGETPAFSSTDPGFGTFDIPVKKIRVASLLSNDFINDAAIPILSWLATNGAENMALVEDNEFINGDATALRPRGILNCGITTVDVEGSTSNTISNTTSSAGSAPKMFDVEYAVPAQYVAKAVWLMRRSIEGKVRKLVDGNGRPWWSGYNQPAWGPIARNIDGYPVENSDFMPADGTDANQVMVFGDLSAYIIAQRAAISSVILRERFADTDQTGFIMFERVGGDLWNPDALRIGVV